MDFYFAVKILIAISVSFLVYLCAIKGRFSFKNLLKNSNFPLIISLSTLAPVMIDKLFTGLLSKIKIINYNSVEYFAFYIALSLICAFSSILIWIKFDENLKDSLNIKIKKSFLIFPIILLIFELLVGNITSLSLNQQKELPALKATNIINSTRLSNGIKVPTNSPATIEFSSLGFGAKHVNLKFTEKNKLENLTIKITDENFSKIDQTVFNEKVDLNKKDSFRIFSSGKLSTLKLEILVNQDIVLESITFDGDLNFKFNFVRFLVIYLVFLFAYFSKRYDLYNKTLNIKNSKHFCFTIISIFLTFLISFSIFSAFVKKESQITINYPLEQPVSSYSPYIQQFDAFQKKQLNLDLQVSPSLASLENPYDISTRDGIQYNWDRAYYNQKYYSYYGVAPIFTVYYPIYFLTSKLPSDLLVCNIFSIFFSVSLSLLIILISIYLIKKPNLALTLILVVTANFVANGYFLQITSSFYCIPMLSGLLNSTLFLNFLLLGYKKKKTLFYSLSGLFYGLAVASRPVFSLLLLFVLPIAIKIVKDKKLMKKDKLNSAISFLIPTFAIAVLLMVFNYLRFGQVAEFGAKYQLTVSNVGFNRIYFENILKSFYHYFLQPINVSSNFPYLSPSTVNLGNYVGYVYIVPCIGVLSFPILWPSIFAFARLKTKASNSLANSFAFIALLLGFVISFANFSLGGANRQYSCDFLFLIFIASFIVILSVYSIIDFNLTLKKIFYYFTFFFALITILQNTLLLFNCEGERLSVLIPNLFSFLKYL